MLLLFVHHFGYAWEWVSKKDSNKFDIEIENVKLRWNSVAIDWINSPNSSNEVGCIHTTQGYDLNYVGVIMGPEIDFDVRKQELVIYKERYKDKAGKNTISDERVLKEYIINIYRTILLRGVKGTFIYACNPNMRNYLAQFMQPHRNTPAKNAFTVLDHPGEKSVPFYDLKVAAGLFSMQSQVEVAKYIVIEHLNANHDQYFACTVSGESMNKVIPNGAMCLFEKYTGGTRNGIIVLVELTDFTDTDSGSSYTIKEYSSKKSVTEEGWSHTEIILLPNSNQAYEPIKLRDEETIRLRVIGIFVQVLLS